MRSHGKDSDRGNPVEFSRELEALVPSAEWYAKIEGFGIELEEAEIKQLGKYLAALMDVNTRTNLSAIRDEEQAWERHIFDALTLVAVLGELPEVEEQAPSDRSAATSPGSPGEERRKKIIDVGSGGGLPGIPLAIVMPGVDFVLLDATKKKTDFIANCVEWLGLTNVEVINGRAEGLGQDKGRKVLQGYEGGHRESYDGAMARAVGKVAMIAELTVPLVKVGGLVVLTKGEKAGEEVAEAKKALHMLHTHHVGTVETPTGRVVVLEKQRTTPKMYPRKDGEPKRVPLGISGS
ncbi:MAG: 16S rRNA (guanine(527)-N(7))-methyltransferase RsmG [Phycisphaerales bacterium]